VEPPAGWAAGRGSTAPEGMARGRSCCRAGMPRRTGAAVASRKLGRRAAASRRTGRRPAEGRLGRRAAASRRSGRRAAASRRPGRRAAALRIRRRSRAVRSIPPPLRRWRGRDWAPAGRTDAGSSARPPGRRPRSRRCRAASPAVDRSGTSLDDDDRVGDEENFSPCDEASIRSFAFVARGKGKERRKVGVASGRCRLTCRFRPRPCLFSLWTRPVIAGRLIWPAGGSGRQG
jgi:hypothetical protein